jgi:hypothetical protein
MSVKIIVIFGKNRTQTSVKGQTKKVCRTFRSNTLRCKHDRDLGAVGRATGIVPLKALKGTQRRKYVKSIAINQNVTEELKEKLLYMYTIYIIYSILHTHTHTHTYIYTYIFG